MPATAASLVTLSWRLRPLERWALALALVAILLFGAKLERRTALRTSPMTDLGVFAQAAWAVRTGDNLYAVRDWHGWHYQYPPMMAILFVPLAHPLPAPLPVLAPGEARTAANTPWGYELDGPSQFAPLGRENARFFIIVAVWYLLSVVFIILSAHLFACALEGARWRAGLPSEPRARHHWWWRRLLPLLVCAGSLGTELSRGQMDVVMLAAVAVGLYLAVYARPFAAGVALAIPAAIKLFPPLLLLYPVWRRQWRMALGVLTGLLLTLIVIPVVSLGPTRTVTLYQQWFEVLAKPALGQGTDNSRARELTNMNATDNQSLLATLHNWHYHALARKQRPAEATPGERLTAYVVGALLLLGVAWAAGWRRRDRPRELLIITGMLIGLAFVTSPIVHHFYYLMLLPLLAALVDGCLADGQSAAARRALVVALAGFMLLDLAARLPGIGASLRDQGLPLLALLYLLGAGVVVLRREQVVIPAPSRVVAG